MKKVLILFSFFMLIHVYTIGQVELGLYAGIDNGRLSGDKLTNTRYAPKTGFLLGLSFDTHVNDIISLSFQPGLITTGSKIQVPDAIVNEYKDSVSVSVNYFLLPIFVKIQSKSKRLYFSAGFEFGYGLSLKADNEIEEIDITDELNKWNVSAAFGIGYRVPIKRSGLYFELRYVQGLVNLAKPEEDDSLPRVKLSGLKILTGFQIPVSKRKN